MCIVHWWWASNHFPHSSSNSPHPRIIHTRKQEEHESPNVIIWHTWYCEVFPWLGGVFLWLKQACCKLLEGLTILPVTQKFPEGIRLCVVWPRWIWASSARCSTRRRLSGRRRSSSLARWSTRCTSRLKPASTRASTSDRSLLHPKRKFRSANPILPMISLPKVVKLPKGEDFNDWLAVHVVDFFNRLDWYCQHDRKKCNIDPPSLFS